ncbi:MAG: ferrous iron transport protein A [Oscillospiraceae bacterium]
MNTLKDLKPGEKGIVEIIKLEGALRRRLVDMGITPGVEIMVRKIAPLGDPIQINLRGYELSIRKDDAANIEIKKISKI